MRIRLRKAYDADKLAVLYRVPHSHDYWPDHRLRVAETIKLANELGVPESVADLSCGDACITNALMVKTTYLGDLAPGYQICGPIEETIDVIPHVGMFICSETIEHLDDPDMVLAKVRGKADSLILSTPLNEPDDRNPEHYWGWDHDGVRDMLTTAQWTPVIQRDVHFTPEPDTSWAAASYQLWACR